MELIIIRHGRPERIEGADGAADPELTEIGHMQAEAMGAWMAAEHLDAIYVSPMARARQTAAPLEKATGLTATVTDGVREYDAEHNTYIPVEELKKDKEAWKAFLAKETEGDRAEFFTEANTTLSEIADNHPKQKVAVVCHGGVINAFASDVLGLPPKMFFNPDYTSINRFLVASTGQRSIRSLGDTGHLRADAALRLYE